MSNYEYIIASLPVLLPGYKYAEGQGFGRFVDEIRENLSEGDNALVDQLLKGFDDASLGEDFYAVIESDIVNEKAYNQGVVYAVKEGKLPAGLSLNADGEIEGVPTEAGEFTFTVGVTATNRAGSGWRAITTVTNFEYDVTITVEE